MGITFMKPPIQPEGRFNRAGFSTRFGSAKKMEVGGLCGIKNKVKYFNWLLPNSFLNCSLQLTL